MGPIENQAQLEKVKGFLEDARQNGQIVAVVDVEVVRFLGTNG